MDDLEKKLMAGIRDALAEKGWSQTALSKQIEIPYRSLQNYLSGTTKMPAVVYVKICEAIGIDNQYVLGQNFEFIHSTFYDALFAVLGDGLLSVEMKENTTMSLDKIRDQNRKQMTANELTLKLNAAYDHYRKEDFKHSYIGRRFPTSSEIKNKKVGQ